MASRGGFKKEKFDPKPVLHVPKQPNGLVVAFDINKTEEIQQFFDTYGFVVVRDVLTPKDCKATLDDIFSMLENGTGFKRDDVTTWSNWPADSLERFGSPHKPPVFLPQFLRNRQNPNVHRVFSLLTHEDNLISNHDRCCFFRPTKAGKTADEQVLATDMPQWDMNPFSWMGDGVVNRKALSDLRYDRLNNFIFENNQPSQSDGVQLQGVLNLADNREEDGGFVCVPGFHKEFEEYMRTRNPNNNASYNFSSKEEPWHRSIRIPMKKGSMVVWDQRMAHGSRSNESSNFRAAQFIKLFPRASVDTTPARAHARATVVRDQISRAGFDSEVSELGRKVFGLD